MKRIIVAAVLIASLNGSQAQDALARDEALKYAFGACLDLKQMLQTPIATDPDVKRPVVIRDGDYGGMILPESKLTAAVLDQAGKEVVPIGQLWLHKLAPLVDGHVVPAGQLAMVTVRLTEGEATVPVFALGLRKTDSGAVELLVYGKGKEPVVRVPAKPISAKQENGIEISADRRDDSGVITLRILGKYAASFSVTDPELY